MSMFNEREINSAMENAIKEKLRKAGLSHLSVKLTKKSGGHYDIDLTGGNANDVKRAEEALGGTAKVIQKNILSPQTIKHQVINSSGEIVDAKPKSNLDQRKNK